MRRIIFGALFIIGGASGQLVLRGTNSSIALVIVGIILVIIGIVQMTSNGEDNADAEISSLKPQDQLSIVNDDKIIVYNKSHESLGVLSELPYGQKFRVNLATEFDRFYQVRIEGGKTGYILKNSRFSAVN